MDVFSFQSTGSLSYSLPVARDLILKTPLETKSERLGVLFD